MIGAKPSGTARGFIVTKGGGITGIPKGTPYLLTSTGTLILWPHPKWPNSPIEIWSPNAFEKVEIEQDTEVEGG